LASSNLIIRRINHFLGLLKKVGKFEEWVANTCSPVAVASFDVDEQVKYHDAVIRFYKDMSGESKNRGSAFPVKDNPDTHTQERLNLEGPEWKEV